MKPSGTIFGMPAPAVANIMQNLAVIAFSYIAARSPNFATEQWAALAGGILTMLTNQLTVHNAAMAPPETFGRTAINGSGQPTLP